MLTAYLVCLVVGGVFVGLSALSGLGKDVDAGGHEADHDVDHEVDHEVDHDVDHDHVVELDHDHAFAHDDDVDHAPSLSEAALAGGARPIEAPRRRFVPFTSFRFWTFGGCFFGLTGVALSQLTTLGEPLSALTSAGVGLAAGTATAALVHRLRRPVGAPMTNDQWIGQTAELLLPLAPGALSKVRVAAGGRERDLVVTLADGPGLPKGTRVVILGIDRDGRALVQPEVAMFSAAAPSRVTRDEAKAQAKPEEVS